MDPIDFNWFTLYPCAMSFFKGCALPPSLLFHALFLSPIQTHRLPLQSFGKTTIKYLAVGGKYSIISHPLILPNTGHTGDLGDAQTPVWGIPGGHHALTCSGIGLQKVVMPQPAWGSSSPRGPRRLSHLDLPRDPILGRPSRLNLPGI